MSDARTLAYLNAVDAAIKVEGNEIQTTLTCPECGGRVGEMNSADHWILFDAALGDLIVVIGCEGYWVVNPSSVGIESENWSGIPGINV